MILISNKRNPGEASQLKKTKKGYAIIAKLETLRWVGWLCMASLSGYSPPFISVISGKLWTIIICRTTKHQNKF